MNIDEVENTTEKHRYLWLPHEIKEGGRLEFMGVAYEVISQHYHKRAGFSFPKNHYYTYVKEVE